MRITGYGGVGEIGGNAFLLESRGRRILLDIGRRFGSDKAVENHGAVPGWGDYFDEFLKPRTFRYVPDLLELGLIPPLGIYRQDLGGVARTDVDAVLVSHAHMDHVGILGLLRPDIPVVASAESKAILESIQDTGTRAPESDFVTTRARGQVGRRKDGELTTKPRYGDGPERSYRTRLDDGWDITPLPVDHSIPGAQAFLVAGADGTVAYTGDFRLHGRGRHHSERLVEKAAGVDVLVAEGTNVHPGGSHKDTDHEVQVEAAIETLITDAARRGVAPFVGIAYPPRDLDRFVSIHAVARRLGRRFAISVKQAHLLDRLRAAGRMDLPDPKTDMSLAVYFEAANKGMLLRTPGDIPVVAEDLSLEPVSVAEAQHAELVASDYVGWQREYLGAPTRIGPLDVRREPGAYIMSLSYWSITELFDIFPDREKAGGLYIHSQTQPFNDEMYQDRRKLLRWLKAFHLDWAETHVSGHLGDEDLAWVLDEIRPRTLVPVHTLAPGLTAERYQARSGQRALLPEWGKPLSLA